MGIRKKVKKLIKTRNRTRRRVDVRKSHFPGADDGIFNVLIESIALLAWIFIPATVSFTTTLQSNFNVLLFLSSDFEGYEPSLCRRQDFSCKHWRQKLMSTKTGSRGSRALAVPSTRQTSHFSLADPPLLYVTHARCIKQSSTSFSKKT